jgi:energy-converting hydrogenase A subunit M
MKITKRHLRRIIKEEKQRLISEKVGKKLFGWLKDKNWEEVAGALETSEDIKTLGDLKFVLDLALAAKTDEKAAEAWGDFAKGGLADMAGLGQVSALADVVKSTYKMDDDATSGVALNYLNVDDDVAKIVDDKIENAFLGELISTIEQAEASGDLDKPLSDFNVTQKLADYIAKDVANDRTVSGFPGATQTEGKMKLTKTQLRRIVQEEKRRLSEGGLAGHYTDKPAGGGAAVEKAKTAIEQQLNSLYHDHMLENADLIAILEQMINDINSGFVGEPT